MVGLREPFYSAMNTFQDGNFFLNEFITEIKLICIERNEEILVNDKQLRHLAHNQLDRLLKKNALFHYAEKWARNALYEKAYDFDKKVKLMPGNNISRPKPKEPMESSKDKIVKALLEVKENAEYLEKRKLQLYGQSEGYQFAGNLLPSIKKVLEPKLESVNSETEKINGVLIALNDVIETLQKQKLAP
ncbi:hypothetical protein [Vibrio diazotrophicus]|uniref:hypothetical protein n=1 Tax=Vibrio diazotrophicus TaxID=685 RepID=UPI000C9E7964|nr:hypothetical protein [Vibrio diazotrophicus]PNH95598.1 hypothetical protein C1O24_13940 [Vibrio diazotrophicus]